jgi:hypothetical protein
VGVRKDVEIVSDSSEVEGSKPWTLGARSPKEKHQVHGLMLFTKWIFHANWRDSSCAKRRRRWNNFTSA